MERREFLKQTAAAGAVLLSAAPSHRLWAQGANERVNVGVISCGGVMDDLWFLTRQSQSPDAVKVSWPFLGRADGDGFAGRDAKFRSVPDDVFAVCQRCVVVDGAGCVEPPCSAHCPASGVFGGGDADGLRHALHRHGDVGMGVGDQHV